ncbi:hypothetical protein GCM10009113_25380 [Marinobacter szutsaonensis]
MGDATAPGQGNTALLRCQLAQQELEKAGFTGTIGTYDGDSLAGLNREIHGF